MRISIKIGGLAKRGDSFKNGGCLIFLTVLNILDKRPLSLIIGAEITILDLAQVPISKIFQGFHLWTPMGDS